MSQIDRCVRGLDEGGFPHAGAPPRATRYWPRSPAQAFGIGKEDIANLVDPAQQCDIDTIDARHSDKRRGSRGEDEGASGTEIARFLLDAGEPLKSGGDPLQRLGRCAVFVHRGSVALSGHCNGFRGSHFAVETGSRV